MDRLLDRHVGSDPGIKARPIRRLDLPDNNAGRFFANAEIGHLFDGPWRRESAIYCRISIVAAEQQLMNIAIYPRLRQLVPQKRDLKRGTYARSLAGRDGTRV